MSIGKFNSENISRQTSIAMWLTFAIIVILLVWCFIIPPRGENAAETLKACTILYAFIPAAITREAIKEGKGAKFTHGDTEVQIAGKKNE